MEYFDNYLKEKDLDNLKLFMGYSSFKIDSVTIYEDEESDYSVDFGYTYI